MHDSLPSLDAAATSSELPVKDRPMVAPTEVTGRVRIALLTGANDPTYAQDLALAMAARGIEVDFIGSNEVLAPASKRIRFLNLRGDQSRGVGPATKVFRVLRYYARLLTYAWSAEPRIFHILWNNKFELLDRTLLMAWYRMTGRRILLTAHNVNAARRDGRDTALNRLTLRIQYRLSDHLFVHTDKMKRELALEFGVPAAKVSVIPFATPDVMPSTALTASEARRRLNIAPEDKVLLFFGQIATYKGLEYLLEALSHLLARDPSYRLVIAGKVKQGHESYWRDLEQRLLTPVSHRVDARIRHIEEQEVELYFKASDVLILPYVEIFQSGVLFMAYRFGLPVVATDVGAFRHDIVEGATGHVCAARDTEALSRAISSHFDSPLYRQPEDSRRAIVEYARIHHSWAQVAAMTERAYRSVMALRSIAES